MPAGDVFRLDEAVADVYGDLRLAPVLHRLLRHTGRLTGSPAGSVSLIDAERGRYVKVPEYGASCRLGHAFPLDEGATGKAYGRTASRRRRATTRRRRSPRARPRCSTCCGAG
jgi:DNA-binding IclR family transcriptional regulator